MTTLPSDARSLLLSKGCLLPADQHVVVDGMVDLGPYVGSKVRIAPKGVQRLLGCDLPVVLALIGAGALDEDLESASTRKRYVWFDPGTTLRDLYDSWLPTMPVPTDYEGWQRLKDMRRRCRVPSGEPLSPELKSAAADFLGEMGTITAHELHGIIACSVGEGLLLSRELQRLWRRGRRRRATGTPMSLESFRALLPTPIANAPETCFDPIDGDLYDPPPPRILGRLARLGPMFAAGSLFMLLKAGSARREALMVEHMRTLERQDGILRAIGDAVPNDRRAIGAALDGYATAGTADGQDRDGVIMLVASAWHDMIDVLRGHASRVAVTDAPLARALGRFTPPEHPERRRFIDGLTERYGHLRPDGERKRKERSDAIADAPDRLAAALELRSQQLTAVADATVSAVEELRLGDAGYVDYGVEGPILNADGSLAEGEQVLQFRCWRSSALIERLSLDAEGHRPVRRKPGRPPAGTSRRGRSVRDVGEALSRRLAGELDGPDHYVEYVGKAPVDPDGGPTAEPWFVTLLAAGTIVRPAMLSLPMRQERRRLILEWDLPGYQGTPAGLLGFGRLGSFVFRQAADLHGMRILPIEEFDHMMRIAHLDYDVQSETSCRVGEALQMCSPADEEHWVERQVDGELLYAFKAFPKQPASGGGDEEHLTQSEFLLSDATLARVADLDELLVRRCHGAGADPAGHVVPVMPAAPSLRWKCAPGRYLFSYDGSALDVAVINVAFRYLAAGLVPFRSHDLRHASANARGRAGETVAEVGSALGQKTRRITRKYMRETEAQRWRRAGGRRPRGSTGGSGRRP